MLIQFQHLETEAALEAKAFEAGSFYFVASSNHVYLDPIGETKRIMINGDIIALESESERNGITPMNGKMYLCLDTNILYFYYNDAWITMQAGSSSGGSDDSGSSYDDTAITTHMNNSTIHITSTERTNLENAISHINDADVHITTSERTNWNAANTHISDTIKHITSDERTNWAAAYTHSTSTHAPSGAEVNQNAYTYFKIGSVSVAAGGKTATLTLVGSNVTLAGNNTTKSVTISLTKANVVAALGYTPLETAPTVTVDSALSDTSTNPVQNKVVNEAINNLNTLVGSTSVSTQISNALANKITYGTTDLTAGSSSLATGTIYLVYE